MAAFSLAGKTAVVTGAGSGIGRSIALRFAEHGAAVEILELNLAKGEQTAAAIRDAGGTAECQECDVVDASQVERAIDAVCDRRGTIDILVNNAGIAHIGSVLETSADDLDRVYRVNVKGVYNCLKTVVKKMVADGGGVILNLASIASLVGIKDRFAYSMSKGAVLTMTYSVAIDYLEHNIRCNCVCPARIHTPFVDGYLREKYPGREQEMFGKLSAYQPIGRMGQPEEVASLALFLCSDEAAFITGSAYPIDGGVSTLP